ncbi:unnamed protein product [Linum tenue]|uniref:NAC domain-containing protein n=1 Tax=Linum tenue TaxID=586396 RepID=A0AAV0IFY3_9ROSI|nr:unnamed protein product [Linum tenue]
MLVKAAGSDLVGGVGAGDFKWPPGFRFHPTDEEMILYYLKRKICRRKLRLNVISELDVYKWDPEDLPGLSLLKTGDRQWFFFSPRDHKYPNGGRANRGTAHGYWKATGKDRVITCNSRNVGVKKTLVFYRGRAPTGERTDWVMHEYTLDEEELKRCPNVKDYYALYKVYKKSGPGPKNGEQYGAPFREEDWVDDEKAVVSVPEVPASKGNNKFHLPPPVCNEKAVVSVPEVPASKRNNKLPLPVCNEKAVCPVEPSSDDLFDLIRDIVEEPMRDPPPVVTESCPLFQVDAEGGAESTVVNSSTRDFTIPKLIEATSGNGQQYENHSGLDFEWSDISKLEQHETPEVTSAANNPEQLLLLSEGDFLEMDDLLGPEPSESNSGNPLPAVGSNVEEPAENLLFNGLDGLSSLELYHDAAMFLRDMGPLGQDTMSQSRGGNVVDEVGYQYQHSAVNQINYEAQLQFDYSWQPEYTMNEVDQSLQTQSCNGLYVNNNLQGSDLKTNGETDYGANLQQTSGMICDSTEHYPGVNQNQAGTTNKDDTSGWFSSGLWSFVDSIPFEPASAAEKPLVNKALLRMSSLRRLRMNIVNPNLAAAQAGNAGGGTANVRKSGTNKGLVVLSLLGILIAVLWVLIGNVKLFGGRSIST